MNPRRVSDKIRRLRRDLDPADKSDPRSFSPFKAPKTDRHEGGRLIALLFEGVVRLFQYILDTIKGIFFIIPPVIWWGAGIIALIWFLGGSDIITRAVGIVFSMLRGILSFFEGFM